MQVNKNISYYLNDAKIIKNKLFALKIKSFGGKNSPYIWFKIPNLTNSWESFDILLSKANIVGTHGSGFGLNGEWYYLLTAFNSLENTLIAMDRFEQIFS